MKKLKSIKKVILSITIALNILIIFSCTSNSDNEIALATVSTTSDIKKV